jgi:beta-glucosidase
LQDWHVESGDFTILVGSSSADIRLTGTVFVESTCPEASIPDLSVMAPSYYQILQSEILQSESVQHEFNVSDTEFAALLGRTPPPAETPVGAAFQLNSTLEDVKHTFIGGLLYRLIRRRLAKIHKAGGIDDSMKRISERMAEEIPLRGLALLSEGMLTFRTIEALLMMINGKYLRGILKLLKGSA